MDVLRIAALKLAMDVILGKEIYEQLAILNLYEKQYPYVKKCPRVAATVVLTLEMLDCGYVMQLKNDSGLQYSPGRNSSPTISSISNNSEQPRHR